MRVGVRANQASVLEDVRLRLPPGWEPAADPVVDFLYSLRVAGQARPGVRSFHLLYGGAARLARTLDLNEALLALEADCQSVTAEWARERVFVHSGVVGWRGKAILLPGKSFTGKSTLVAELVRRGAEYYSDEYAVIDTEGLVHPYPRPLSLRTALGERARRVPLEELGTDGRGEPLPAGLIAVCPYTNASRWRPRPLSAGEAVLELLGNTVSARRQPGEALAMLTLAAARARAVRGGRPEAPLMAAALLRLLDAPA